MHCLGGVRNDIFSKIGQYCWRFWVFFVFFCQASNTLKCTPYNCALLGEPPPPHFGGGKQKKLVSKKESLHYARTARYF